MSFFVMKSRSSCVPSAVSSISTFPRLVVTAALSALSFSVALPAAAQTVGCRQKLEEIQWKIDYAEESGALAHKMFLELQEEKLKQKCADGTFAREQKIRVEAAQLNVSTQKDRLAEEEAKLLDVQMLGDKEKTGRQQQKIEERRRMMQDAERALIDEQERERPL